MQQINSFTLIGPGKVGIVISYLLKKIIKLESVIGSSSKNNYNVNQYLSCDIIDFPDEINADLILIATPDDKVVQIVDKLKKINIKNKLIIHFSGILTSEIIKINDNEAISIHPIMSFTDIENSLKTINNHYFSIEGNENTINNFLPIFEKITNKYFIIQKEEKPFYHLSCVLINNFVTAMVQIGADLTKSEYVKYYLPLIEDVLINMENTNNPIDKLTGPIVRNDISTIEKHKEILKNNQNILNIYNSVTHYITEKIKKPTEKN